MAKAQKNDKMDFRPVPTTIWEWFKLGMKCTESKIMIALTPFGLTLGSLTCANIMGEMISGRVNPSFLLGGTAVGIGAAGVGFAVSTVQKTLYHGDRFAAKN